MASIALIGPDGAGKTTITRMLEESGLLPFRYLYMGINTSSSNLALPSSRLIEYLKPRLWKRPEATRRTDAVGLPRHEGRTTGGALWATARLANRLAEEWFRQLASWYYQCRGFVVLYDRHFLFDFLPDLDTGVQPFDRWLHRWCLLHLYPQPNLVIFLDAPGEILFARKGESTVEELERRRQALLGYGAGRANFVRVDATRSLDRVYEEVARHVVHFPRRERSTVRPDATERCSPPLP